MFNAETFGDYAVNRFWEKVINEKHLNLHETENHHIRVSQLVIGEISFSIKLDGLTW